MSNEETMQQSSKATADGGKFTQVPDLLTFLNAPIFVAIGSAACVVISVSYDWGYFRVVGPRFFYSLSLNDHVAAALDRLPPIIFMILATIPTGYLFRRILDKFAGLSRTDFDMSEGRLKKNVSEIKLKRLNKIWWGCTVLFVSFNAVIALIVEGGYYLAFGGLGIVGLELVRRFRLVGISENLRRKSRWYFALFTLLVLGPIFIGYSVALRDLQAKDGKQMVVLRDGTPLKNVTVLRYTSASVLLRHHERDETRLIVWDSIKEIIQPGVFEPTSFGCIYLKICSPSPALETMNST